MFHVFAVWGFKGFWLDGVPVYPYSQWSLDFGSCSMCASSVNYCLLKLVGEVHHGREELDHHGALVVIGLRVNQAKPVLLRGLVSAHGRVTAATLI